MKTIQWFTDSPDAGDPACICSWCGAPITEADAPPIRMFDTQANREARFHMKCAGPAIVAEYTVDHDFDTFDNQELQ